MAGHFLDRPHISNKWKEINQNVLSGLRDRPKGYLLHSYIFVPNHLQQMSTISVIRKRSYFLKATLNN